jgi:hypothetical protein
MPGQTIEVPIPGRVIERGIHKDRGKSRGKDRDRDKSKDRDRGKNRPGVTGRGTETGGPAA